MGGLGGGVRNPSPGRRSPDPDMKSRGQVRSLAGRLTSRQGRIQTRLDRGGGKSSYSPSPGAPSATSRQRHG